MNYADIRPIDVANGPGIRVSLFVSGCTHACPETNRETRMPGPLATSMGRMSA